MALITENASFKLSTIILSKKEPFTLNEVVDELQKVGVKEPEQSIKRALNRLRDNDIITEFGSTYALNFK